jgi:ubiquinone biosynthesis protein COQ4
MLRGGSRRSSAVEATRAVMAILKDPDDTKQVFRLLEAMSGDAPQRVLARMQASRAGAALLAGRPDLLTALGDREALERTPEGSVARAYLAFMDGEGITADGLVRASEDGGKRSTVEDDDAAWLDRRLRDSHDLWHAVLGYRGDLIGESAVLAFSYAQTWATGVGLLASIAVVKADDADARRIVVDGFVRGLRSAWLPAVPWERWLAEPVDVVRQRLRVGTPPAYEPFYAKDLPPGGLFGTRAPLAA